jgi:predicted outer membrane protein
MNFRNRTAAVLVTLFICLPGKAQDRPTTRGPSAPTTPDRPTTSDPSTPTTPDRPAQDRSTTTSTTAASADTNDQEFLRDAAEMNNAEVQISRLAQTKTQNSRVRTYAEMMVRDHTQALARVQRLMTGTAGTGRANTGNTNTNNSTGNNGGANTTANQNNTTANQNNTTSREGNNQANRTNESAQAQLSKEHRDLQTRLSGLSGAEFDREYIRAMVNDHRQAVTKFESRAGGSATSNTPSNATRRPTGADNANSANNTGNSANNNANRGSDSARERTASASSSSNTMGGAASLARELLPSLRKHLQEAQSIEQSLGASNQNSK